MPRFRRHKTELLQICAGEDWKRRLDQAIDGEAAARSLSGPLLALLPRPECSWQAAYGLGLAAALLAQSDMDAARNFMRRLMWSMNEESGNLGWGIPEAMGCILAESRALAREYSRIFISYGHDTGREDNFVEYAPLRRGVYWGTGRLAAADAATALPALPHLVRALEDADAGIRGMAAFALRELAGNLPPGARPQEEQAARWRAAARALERASAHAQEGAAGREKETAIRLLDGQQIVSISVERMLSQALEAVRRHAVLPRAKAG